MRSTSVIARVFGYAVCILLLQASALPDVREAWTRIFDSGRGQDYCAAVTVDKSGGAVVTGDGVGLRGYANICTIRYNGEGHMLWTAWYDSGIDDGWGAHGSGALAVTTDGNGNVYVTGMSYGGRNHYYDYATIKYDPNGKELWVARYDGPAHGLDTPTSIAVDAEGNVYVTGTCERPYPFYQDIATVKYDKDGKQQWVAWYNGSGVYDYGRRVLVDKASNIYVSGYTSSREQAVTLKYSPEGTLLWERIEVTNFLGRPYGMQLDDAGNVYVAARRLLKYAPDGSLLWARDFVNRHTLSASGANGLALDGSGNAYVVKGNATIKYSLDGDLMWVTHFWNPDSAIWYEKSAFWNRISVDAEGGVYVGGAAGKWEDIGVAKYSPDGKEIWRTGYPGRPNDKEARKQYAVLHGMAVTLDGCIYVVGETKTGRLVDWVTIKYEQTP